MRRLGATALLLVGAFLAFAATATALQFVDRSDEAGVDFQHAGEIHPAGNDTWPAFPSVNGAGACFADFDGDGFDDLYLVSQAYNSNNPATGDWANDTEPTNELYLNDGDGTFTQIDSGAESTAFGYGCSAADYDADGDVDLYVTNVGPNQLFENTGNGTFVNATAEAGVSGAGACGAHPCSSIGSAWADVDADGDLDLYVGNYVDTNLTDTDRRPAGHRGQENLLFENQGDGTFVETARQAGVAGNPTDLAGSKSLGVVFFDHDRDGDPDLYVANDERANDFYDNDGDGTFTERSDDALLADTRASMGIAVGDYDQDGYEDLFFTHFATEDNGFYHNERDGTFDDRSGEDELSHARPDVGWGTAFRDVDLDGDLDLVSVNGDTEWTRTTYEQTTRVFRQDENQARDADPANANWTETTGPSGFTLIDEKVSRGAAFADVELDGDTDIAIVNNANDTIQLLEAQDVDNDALTVRLEGTGDNPNAIGAHVAVTVDDRTMHRWVRAGSSYASQNSLALSFGLGEAQQADAIRVDWPDGTTSTFDTVPAQPVIAIDKASETIRTDTIAPTTQIAVTGPEGDGDWFTDTVDVRVTAQDRGVSRVSGVADREIAIGDDPFAPFDAPVELGEGVHRVHHRATDHAGNVAPRETTLVRMDATSPVPAHTLNGTRGNAGWFTSQRVNVTLNASDALSGVAEIEYRVDGGGWQTYNGTFGIQGDGVHAVVYRATDVAGNLASTDRVEIRIDSTPPSVDITRPDRGHVYVDGEAVLDAITGPAAILLGPQPADDVRSFEVHAEAGDATSGVDRVEFHTNGQPRWIDQSGPDYSWTWPVHREPAGLWGLDADTVDEAGNTARSHARVLLAAGTPDGLDAAREEGPAAYARIAGVTLHPALGSPGSSGAPFLHTG